MVEIYVSAPKRVGPVRKSERLREEQWARSYSTSMIDGTPLKGRQRIVTLGIGCDGRKTVLGLRVDATENTAVLAAY